MLPESKKGESTESANKAGRLQITAGTVFPLDGSAPREIEEFVQVLSQRGYTGLELEARTIEGERHAGNKPEAFNRGLRFVFQDK